MSKYNGDRKQALQKARRVALKQIAVFDDKLESDWATPEERELFYESLKYWNKKLTHLEKQLKEEKDDTGESVSEGGND